MRTLTIAFLFSITSFFAPKKDVLFSFKTEKGKSVILSKLGNTLIYSYGTSESIELQIEDDLNDSTTVFQYSYIFRGGGEDNLGLDLNWVYFDNKGYRYVIFDEYNSESKKSQIGIKVINLKTKRTFIINGISSTKQGSIVDFRFNEMIPIGDEWFE